ncbi:putative ADP/ATP translocase [Trypanosoma cruzi]|uniref:ADP/ATP translocase, putative n=2 Tax=Trypanosoma cruzi TaxID=5693 RepID=Q4DDY7_TRYCC|nr:ADP/ATP translocase, putative [Trypanosoma cruzi]EAN90731.1 ADP/ATP translocase, putative [Trypanosoma cruzi]PWV14507.1 putative ADP/ATP translocase [Trypanosoma cruzi]|eukprot:XP_812582.1 ADP/ATP translocase [Trypanosoma cruzi strain CL Brener]
MSSEATVVEHQPAYRPDDPEFYLQDQGQRSSGAELVNVLGRIAIRVARLIALNCLWAPVNRIFLLQCTEGELIQNGRLSHGGFGGMRGCVHYIMKKEGAVGLFRGCFTEMALSIPAYIAQVTVILFTVRLQQQLVVISRPASVMLGVAAPGLRVLLTAPIVGSKKTVMGNFAADIVACKGDVVTTDDEEEEAYLYCSAWEAAAAVQKRWGWKGLFFKGVDVDIIAIYTQSLTMQLMGMAIAPKVEEIIEEQFQRPGRKAAAMIACTIGVRLICSFLFQPFQVIRARMTLLSTSVRQKQKRNRRFWHHAKDILRQDGITAFWAGLRMRFLLDVGGILLSTLMVH